MTAPATPHPAERLPGLTKRVTLSSGIEVLLRRVDLEAVTLDATQHVMNRHELLQVAGEHAQEAAQAVAALDPGGRRPSALSVEAESALAVSKSVLRATLLQPRLEELIALYGGREDQSEPDLGLGPDFADLLYEAGLLSIKAGDRAAAERFLESVGRAARQPGPALRPAAV